MPRVRRQNWLRGWSNGSRTVKGLGKVICMAHGIACTDIKWQKIRAGANFVRLWVCLHGFSEEDKRFKRIQLAVHEFSEPKAKYHLMINLTIRCFKLFGWRTSFRPAWHACGL
jgi:hypothetical protein